MKLLIEIGGWIGIVLIFAAYCLNSFSIINSHSLTYQLLNLFGAIGVIIVSSYKKVWQPAILNIIWAMISCIVILNILIK